MRFDLLLLPSTSQSCFIGVLVIYCFETFFFFIFKQINDQVGFPLFKNKKKIKGKDSSVVRFSQILVQLYYTCI